MRVESISTAPVKGTSLLWSDSCRIDVHGVPGDRLFHVLDAADGRQLSANPGLLPIRSRYEPTTNVLALQTPGADPVSAAAELGGPVVGTIAWDGGRQVRSRVVLGPWNELISAQLDRDVVLARPVAAHRAVDAGPITLVASESIHELGQHLGTTPVDPGRFRMNLYLRGLSAYEEDSWYGRRVIIGDAVVRIRGPVPRCVIVTYNPSTGLADLPVLKAIVQSRSPIIDPTSGESVRAPFGVFADIERPGRATVGDAVDVLA